MATVFQAIKRNARISPRKARLSVDIIRGRRVEDALNQLEFDNRRSAGFVRKVLLSAVNNAQERGGVDPMDLCVTASFVDEGVTLRRFRPCGRGRAHGIKKRCSHITVAVGTQE